MCVHLYPVLICYLSVGNPHSMSVPVLNSLEACFFFPLFILGLSPCAIECLRTEQPGWQSDYYTPPFPHPQLIVKDLLHTISV